MAPLLPVVVLLLLLACPDFGDAGRSKSRKKIRGLMSIGGGSSTGLVSFHRSSPHKATTHKQAEQRHLQDLMAHAMNVGTLKKARNNAESPDPVAIELLQTDIVRSGHVNKHNKLNDLQSTDPTNLTLSFHALLRTSVLVAKSSLQNGNCQRCLLSFLAKVIAGPFAPFLDMTRNAQYIGKFLEALNKNPTDFFATGYKAFWMSFGGNLRSYFSMPSLFSKFKRP